MKLGELSDRKPAVIGVHPSQLSAWDSSAKVGSLEFSFISYVISYRLFAMSALYLLKSTSNFPVLTIFADDFFPNLKRKFKAIILL